MADKNVQSAERVVVEIYGNSYPLKTDDPRHIKMIAAASFSEC